MSTNDANLTSACNNSESVLVSYVTTETTSEAKMRAAVATGTILR